MLTGVFLTDPCRKFECVEQADPSNPEVCARLEKIRKDLWVEYVGKCGIIFYLKLKNVNDYINRGIKNMQNE